MQSYDKYREFLIWARSQKIKRVKLENCEFEFSELAFVEDYQVPTTDKPKNSEEYDSSDILAEAITPQNRQQNEAEDEELLLWSSR